MPYQCSSSSELLYFTFFLKLMSMHSVFSINTDYKIDLKAIILGWAMRSFVTLLSLFVFFGEDWPNYLSSMLCISYAVKNMNLCFCCFNPTLGAVLLQGRILLPPYLTLLLSQQCGSFDIYLWYMLSNLQKNIL